MANDSEIKFIKRLCILNFLELQDIRRKLGMPIRQSQEFYDYANSVPDFMKELDDRMQNLIRDYPHVWDGK